MESTCYQLRWPSIVSHFSKTPQPFACVVSPLADCSFHVKAESYFSFSYESSLQICFRVRNNKLKPWTKKNSCVHQSGTLFVINPSLGCFTPNCLSLCNNCTDFLVKQDLYTCPQMLGVTLLLLLVLFLGVKKVMTGKLLTYNPGCVLCSHCYQLYRSIFHFICHKSQGQWCFGVVKLQKM